ncbi:MAG: sigma-54-dependent Fis family transcriptional regulator [Myxococcales bacterium]|nr:sigma-54-dependent Fis family transcriptional regulator [Myxococcales bacterium]
MVTQGTLLLVFPELATSDGFRNELSKHGYDVLGAQTTEEALALVAAHPFDLVIADADACGLELLEQTQALEPRTRVILLASALGGSLALDALRAGAVDYARRPDEPRDLILMVERVLRGRANESAGVDATEGPALRLGPLVTTSPAMQAILHLIERLAESDAPILLTGETGTGKGLVARAIHKGSARAERPFVSVNCAAIPDGLLESELFGHVRGAFSGAHTTRSGLFAEAHGGTLFLDEIGEMGAHLQSKLLHVLQGGEVRAVGANAPIRVDARVIASTNRDLRSAMEVGEFRRDLYYRICVIPIRVPALRSRPQDIRLIAEDLVQRHAGDRTRLLSNSAIWRLQEHRWVGNVRELENVLIRTLALSDQAVIEAQDLQLEDDATLSSSPLEEFAALAAQLSLSLRRVQDAYIEAVLAHCDGSKAEAAEILGIHRATLYRRDT